MNSLEKMFNSIRNAPSRELKMYSTRELVKQLAEYEDHTLYILRSIYQLLTSESFLNRICGAKILNRMSIFEYSLDFHLSSVKASDYVYLQFKDIREDSVGPSKVKQRSAIKKKLSLEHVEAEFLDAIELEKASTGLVHKTAEYREKDIENVYDFFEAISLILLSPDWFKRHGGFVAYCAIISTSDPFDDMDGSSRNLAGGGTGSARHTAREDRIKIKLSGDLFNKIFEILKNDKFNDFQDDITSSPVRESASLLLKFIYPLLNNDMILFEITHLLTSPNWQEQFSGLIALSHLKEYFSEELVASKSFVPATSEGNAAPKRTLVDLLIGLLDSDDEDVKYISADLLNDVILRFAKERNANIDAICKKCWAQIEDEVDIAHSKASLIILLKTIYDKFSLPPPESFTSLYPCFTSPVSLVRSSVLELSKTFEGTEFLYLLGESILLEPYKEKTDCKKSLEILLAKVGSAKPLDLRDFGNHFLRIISLDINTPYREDDFGCYEEAFFTVDGIKSMGSVHNLNNRAILFSAICGIEGLDTSGSTTLLGASFCSLYRIASPRSSGCGQECPKDSTKRIKALDKGPSTAALKDILMQSIDQDFRRYASLKRMPIQEFRAMIEDPFYLSLYPLCYSYCLEYIRMIVCANLDSLIDFSLYFILENSAEFFRVVSSAILRSMECDSSHYTEDAGQYSCTRINAVVDAAWKLLITLHGEKEFLEVSRKNSELFAKIDSKKGYLPRKKQACSDSDDKSHKELIVEQGIENLTMFFEVLGSKLFCLDVFNSIMANPERLIFFEHTIRFYLEPQAGMARASIMDVFNEALEKRNVKILKELMSDIEFNCLFVKHVLKTFDMSLLSSLLDYSDPTLNVLFVKPVLKSMHAMDAPAKIQSTLSRIICSVHFCPNPKITDQALLTLIDQEKEDVQMMMNPGLISDYSIKVDMGVQLRDYQKEGIKWLSFLSRFNLNGILADDMGLGKTVQVLTFLVNEMYSQGLAVGNGTGAPSSANDVINSTSLKSLVICPSSLCTHWKEELGRYFKVDSAIYEIKKPRISTAITICSYDTLRRDSFLGSTDWFMVVFDEGHVLKNRSTVLYSKVKCLKSDKKTILTGTPVHNSVEDIFSLFDIIMPGYLGTESEFLSLYNCKINDKNVQVMESRLESLQKKILPFVMRRLKSDVLKDLPPKIIKDLVVELSPGQLDLYTKIQQGEGQETAIDEQGYACLKNMSLIKTKDLLKAASHPRYFNTSIPSSKTSALQDIFTMCGGENVQRKVLVFFQFKKTIDFVVEELQLTNYLRLDGAVPASQRGQIVNRFNSEAVPYLFLTTSVGGLGLNLTSADTVVFYEHDWNPFNDLQAMDRAHRLGQKNVVNVFRLISKGTIEEKVMNYQNFKLYVAKTLVTQQNNEIETMDTKDILERFQ